jgi:hypothetical protein
MGSVPIGVYFPKVEICQNSEEFLTTKVHKGAEGRNKALLHASFVRLFARGIAEQSPGG